MIATTRRTIEENSLNGSSHVKVGMTVDEFVEWLIENREELHRRTASLLRRIGVPNARVDAEDLVGNVVLKILRNLERVDRERPFMGYAWSSVRRACSSFAKQSHRRLSRVDSQMACEDIAAPSTVSNDLAVAVRNALDKVSANEREIVLKRVAAGLTYAAIADMRGVSPSSVVRCWQRAQAKLAIALNAWRLDR